MKKVLSFLNKYKFIYVPGILGAIAFIVIYSAECLNPFNTGWIMARGGDITQHYVGWELYRYSPWSFPIGMNTISPYPFGISVIFTDSIPLFAVFFKLISGILPEYFQYIGMYGIFCFIMQGIMSAIVLKKFIKNDYLIMILSLFFIFSPIMIYRMFYHTSLASHYLILMGFALVLYKDKFSWKKTILLWGLLGLLSASTHIYFLLFNGMILVGYMLYEVFTTRDFRKIIFSFLSYLLIAGLTVYVLGGFHLASTPLGHNSIGAFNFNLNGFFNPYETSNYLKQLPSAENLLQEEGFSYLGLGLIILLPITLLAFVYKLIRRKKIDASWKLIVPIILVALFSIGFATMHQVYYGNTLLFEYKIPLSIERIVSMFRSNGRLIWICYYIIILSCIYLTYKIMNKKVFAVLIILLFGIQIKDISKEFEMKKWMIVEYNYEQKLKDSRWDRIFNEDFEHIILPLEFEMAAMYDVNMLAIKHNKTVNKFYIAQDLINDKVRDKLDEYRTTVDSNNLFIINSSSLMRYNSMPINYYKLDDQYIATPLNLDYLESVNPKVVEHIANRDSFIWLEFDQEKVYDVIVTSVEGEEIKSIKLNNEDLEVIDNTVTFTIDRRSESFLTIEEPIVLRIKIMEVE